MISEELRSRFGDEMAMPGWHKIWWGRWTNDRTTTKSIALLTMYFLLVLFGVVIGMLPIYFLGIAALTVIAILFMYFFFIRRDTVITGYAATIDTPTVDLVEDLQEALHGEGIRHATYPDDDGKAMIVEDKVTVFLRVLADGTAVHVGPLTARTRRLVPEVMGLIDRITSKRA